MSTKRLVLAALVALSALAAPTPAAACTTAVISGAATPDGRPLLWKNRDADDLRNQVVYREDGRFAYLGVVNGADVAGMQIWAGVNGAGLAIMNSASYNLEPDDTEDEGRLMKLALQSCRTVDDFQRLLELTDEPGRDVSANFGVIDAAGGAAIFETRRHGFTRFDAAAAPGGLLIRTNYSDSGDPAEGSGLLRRERATAVIAELQARDAITVGALLASVCRDVANAHLGALPIEGRPAGARFAFVGDSINRDITASTALFAGVKPGEDPLLTTFWVLLGQPVTGVAVPLWVRAGAVPAELAGGREQAPLSAAGDRVRALLYPSRRGDLKRYLAVEPLRRLLPRLLAAEAANLERAARSLDAWLKHPPEPAAVAAAQAEIAAATLAAVAAIE